MAQTTKVVLPFVIICGCVGATALLCRMGTGDRLPSVAVVRAATLDAKVADQNEQLARTDPLRFLQHCLDYHRAHVRDYRCTFSKQESVQGIRLPEQVADVRFREEPFSVDMTFTRNVGECKRALYVAGRWVDAQGNELALAKPGGAILRAFLPQIKQPIHGRRARRASRRTIDQFGFSESLELILKYSRKAQAEGKLKLEYVGHGAIGGRPTYVFERNLPYTGDEKDYPDKLLVFHVDRQYLVPTACYCYADEARQALLGSYLYTDIQMNPRYTNDDFDPDKLDF
jgi:hypothetical protein